MLRTSLTACLLAICGMAATAQDLYLHGYSRERVEQKATDPEKGIEYVTGYTSIYNAVPWADVDSMYFTTSKGLIQRLTIHATDENGKTTGARMSLSGMDRIAFGTNPAEFRIVLTDSVHLKDVYSKKEYLQGNLTINGFGVYDDFSGDMQIRGRGNSTWGKPKKAYRLKLPAKTKLLGYRKSKNYVLLANYIDLSMMRNEVAALTTQMVGMPYPTHATPCNVYFNDNYKGSYMLMEKVGINNGSVNIPAAQEAESIMFELDVNFDEDYKAVSPYFSLPLQHKDPDAPADPTQAKEWFGQWVEDFKQMEHAVYEGKNIGQYVDYETLAKFLLTFNLACNQEINHPKSIYLYKTRGGKYQFGPCWDFDWAFGYGPTYRATLTQDISHEEAEAMIDEMLEWIKNNFPGATGYVWFERDGAEYIWTSGRSILINTGSGFAPWPYDSAKKAPTYDNFLLGTGKNTGTAVNEYYGRAGNGGEFFLSMIMDNAEFMDVYKRVWADFYSRLPEFWAAFDAYAAELEPTAAKDHTLWPYKYDAPTDPELNEFYDGTQYGAIAALRAWLQRRIEFLNNPANNYGLYDPATTYKRGNLSTK